MVMLNHQLVTLLVAAMIAAQVMIVDRVMIAAQVATVALAAQAAIKPDRYGTQDVKQIL